MLISFFFRVVGDIIRRVVWPYAMTLGLITFLYISVVSIVFTVFLLCFIVLYGFAALA